MRKYKGLSLLILIFPFFANAQSAYQEVREGNELFKSNDYTEAEEKYRESVRKDGELVESAYNLGNSLYRQGKYEDAGRYFLQAANKAKDDKMKSKAFHNLGNSLIKDQKLEEGIKAYKNALINNPENEESRYNLAYAQQQLQQQQQQQQQEQQDDQQDQNKDEQKEENKDQQEQEDQEEEKEEEQEQQQEQEEEQEQDQQEQQQQEQKEDQVSREDAERILEALNNDEKELQEKLKKQKIKQVDINIEKDW